MRVPVRLGCAAAVAAILACATAHAEVTTLASRPYVAPDGFGVEGDGDSFVDDGALSSDGRWLVFSSNASNLVPGDVNGDHDVFLRDNDGGALIRIAAGRQPVISSDGAWIAFATHDALVPEDRNFLKDVYIVNRDTLVFERVSVGDAGDAEGNDQSFSPSVSGDGRYVAFASNATTMAGVADNNGFTDIFVRDRTDGTTTLVSQGPGGVQADGPSADPSISADGAFVAFESRAGNLDVSVTEVGDPDSDVFRRDIGGGITEYVSIDEGGTEGNGESFDPSISASGQFVAFDSLATNLTTQTDDNGTHDIFRRDMTGSGALLVSRTQAANQAGDSSSFAPSISADGARVLFRSFASDLTGESLGVADAYLRDITESQTYRVNAGTSPDREILSVALAPGVARAAFSSEMTNLPTPEAFPGRIDVFISGTIPGPSPVLKASVATSPVTGGANGKSFEPDLSADGRYVAFTSLASNLVPDDNNDTHDIFRFDTTTGSTVRVTRGEGELLGPSDSPAISADGRWIAFVTGEENNSPTFDGNGLPDVWVRDMSGSAGSEFEVVSVDSPGSSTGSNGDFGSSEPSISGDGNLVAFVSDHTNLIEGDTNDSADVFVRDRALGTTVRVNVASNGAPTSGNDVGGPALSADGSVVAFHSNATGLVPGDENSATDVFVHEFGGDTTTLVSVADDGTPGNGASFGASVSADGRYVAFMSAATNLVPDDSPNLDIFVRDRVAGRTTKVSVNTAGEGANGLSADPRISGDGRFVVFRSTGSNLGGPAGLDSTFIHDRLRGATAFLATDANAFGNRNSSDPVISADGTRYAIVSDATNWTTALAGYRAGDVNVWTGTTPRTTLLSIDSDSPDPSPAGTAVTVTYTLSASSGTPVGLVTFSATSGESCSVSVGAPACPLTFVDGGVRTISAYYSGDTVSFPARSPGETHTVEGAGEETGFTGETPLVAPDGDEGDAAGSSVASSDEFVVLGAPNGGDGEGAVYVFQRVTNAVAPRSAKAVAGLVAAKDLQPVATLANPNGAGGLGDKWGGAVAISPDGATIVIGAPGAGGGSGAAAVFNRPGVAWTDDSTPDASLVPSTGVGLGDKFGSAVAVGTNDMVAVGAPGAASGGDAGAGAAHVFNGTTPVGTLTPDPVTADANAGFGQSLAMSGGRLVVGAPNEGAGDNGAVRLYDVTATTVSAPTMLAPTGGAGIGDKWGTSVAIDGTTVVGGAPGASGGNGAGVVFQDTGGGMTQRGRLDGGVDAAGAGTGMAVAVAGDYIMLGAPLATVEGRANQGRAFVFVQPEGGWQDSSAVGSLASADGGEGDGYGSALALTRRGAVVGIPNRDFGTAANQGQADSFVVDRIFRAAFE